MASKYKDYTINQHFPEHFRTSFNNYKLLSDRLLGLDSRLKEEPRKLYIGFKIDNRVVVAVRINLKKIILELYRVEPSDLRDPNKKVRYLNNSYEDYNKHVSVFHITTPDDVSYATDLASQVLEKFFQYDN